MCVSTTTNYENGYEYLKDDKDGGKLGFSLKPGPGLEYKILKTRVDSDKPVKGFYTLLLPTNISDYGVLDKLQYIGTARKIEELKFGDILVGESGTWRSLVLLSNYDKCITNSHGVRIRHNKDDLVLSIFVRSMLAWYYKEHVFDYMVVGGSGGHLSPSYYDRIMIPNFPREIQEKTARLYYDSEKKELGIAQLNEKRLKLLDELDLVLDNIINDKEVVITLN